MSNDPNRPSSEDHPTADSPSPAETPRPRRVIKIGSQREVDNLDYLKPKDVSSLGKPATEQAPATVAETPAEAPPETPPAEATTDTPPTAVEQTQTVDSTAGDSTVVPDPEQIEKALLAPRGNPSAIDPASFKEEDLDAEIEAALGDMSLDDLVKQEDKVASEGLLETETRHQGRVIKIHKEYIFVTMGSRHEGVISMRQFPDEPPAIGTILEVVVSGYNAGEDLYELTVPGAAVQVGDWSDLQEGVVVNATVTGSNKGGLECEVNKIRGFIPASQISLYRTENLEEFVGQKLQCLVTEARPEKRNLVLSCRALLEREREASRKTLLASLEVGQTHEGVVSRIQDFGAFVDIGGIDGLVHVSQMSWDRVNHPSELLSEGDKIKVRVEKIDPQTGKIGLSYRNTQDNPWDTVDQKYPENSTVTGTVSRVAQFGAFVKLEPGVEGLIHISELAYHRVLVVTNIVKEGQEVETKVISVDPQAQRISLSLKATMTPPVDAKTKTNPEDELPDGTREMAVPERTEPLKGGVDTQSEGDKFGLKW